MSRASRLVLAGFVVVAGGGLAGAAAQNSAARDSTAREDQELANAARGASLEASGFAAMAGLPVRRAMARAPQTMQADVLVDFQSGSARLTPRATRDLDALGGSLGEGERLKVEGFSDTVGSRDANFDLAERRAEAVAAYLEVIGMASDRLDVVAYPKLLVSMRRVRVSREQ